MRGKGCAPGLQDQYVNDRPYVASSFLSVAISQVYGSALQGRCKDRPELAATAIPLEARLDVLPVRGGERFLRAVFEPLGYSVEAARHPGASIEPVAEEAAPPAGAFGRFVLLRRRRRRPEPDVEPPTLEEPVTSTR